MTYRTDSSTSPPKGAPMARQQVAAPVINPTTLGQMAAAGMAMAPSAEVGLMGHFAHLQQTVGTPAPVVEPAPTRRGR